MNLLERILDTKRDEVARLRARFSAADLRERARTRVRPFGRALRENAPVALIAEVKKASPSKGLIQPDFRPLEIAAAYERAGAAAISVLTDEVFFQGGNDILARVRDAVSIPVLRKDFIVDALQIYESRAIGADAVLLIAAALDDGQLREFYALARELGMDALVEVHSPQEYERVAGFSPGIVGVNNRDLRTFAVDLGQTAEVAALVTHDAVIVSESGIATREDVARVRACGASAILVGETLMRGEVADIPGRIAALLPEKDGSA